MKRRSHLAFQALAECSCCSWKPDLHRCRRCWSRSLVSSPSSAVILGGNIRGQTRTLTTVIALEYSKGDDARAIAMGVILVAVALGINGLVHGAGLWRAEERT